jgi:hypothetical protein
MQQLTELLQEKTVLEQSTLRPQLGAATVADGQEALLSPDASLASPLAKFGETDATICRERPSHFCKPRKERKSEAKHPAQLELRQEMLDR